MRLANSIGRFKQAYPGWTERMITAQKNQRPPIATVFNTGSD